MSKIRNDKIDGNWYTDEYIRTLIDTIERKNKIIKKAIEYLKENACYEEDTKQFCRDLLYSECLELLNILEGEDK